jgi:hypothetical protein
MKVAAVLFALIASFIQAEEVSYLESTTGRHFAVIDADVTFEGSAAQCEKLGGKLAEMLVDEDFTFLSSSSAFSKPAWIKSFQGKSYNDVCMAFFAGGAIATPIGNCKAKQNVLCEL